MRNLTIQLPDSSYKSLQKLTEQDGVSLDQFIALAVAKKIAALTTKEYLQARASQGNRSKYESVLAKVAQSLMTKPPLPHRFNRTPTRANPAKR